jgi:hypothetical protein
VSGTALLGQLYENQHFVTVRLEAQRTMALAHAWVLTQGLDMWLGRKRLGQTRKKLPVATLLTDLHVTWY